MSVAVLLCARSITHVQTKLLRSQLDDAVDEVQEHLHKDGRSKCWAASKGCMSCFLLASHGALV